MKYNMKYGMKIGDIINIKPECSDKYWYHTNYMKILELSQEHCTVDYDFGEYERRDICLVYVELNNIELRKKKLESL